MLALSLLSHSSSDDSDAASSPAGDDRSTSIISEGAQIEGVLNFVAVDLRIEGAVRGDISTDGRVVVAEGAVVEGTVEARTVRLAGRVHGYVRAEETLVLCPSSEVRATLEANVLEIQPGADFAGMVPGEMSADFKEGASAGRAIGPAELVPVERESSRNGYANVGSAAEGDGESAEPSA